MATIEFTGYALTWWNSICRAGARPTTWAYMKDIMHHRFVPEYYTRSLYQRLQRLQQGSMTVDAYYKEMELLMIRAGVTEDEDATMARFLNGLSWDIQDRVDMSHYHDLQSLVHYALRAEQ